MRQCIERARHCAWNISGDQYMVAINTVAICGQCGKAGAENLAKTVENTFMTPWRWCNNNEKKCCWMRSLSGCDLRVICAQDPGNRSPAPPRVGCKPRPRGM